MAVISWALANGAEKDGRESKVGEFENSGVFALTVISGGGARFAAGPLALLVSTGAARPSSDKLLLSNGSSRYGVAGVFPFDSSPNRAVCELVDVKFGREGMGRCRLSPPF